MPEGGSTTAVPYPTSVGDAAGVGADAYGRFGKDGLTKDAVDQGKNLKDRIDQLEDAIELQEKLREIRERNHSGEDLPDAIRKSFQDFSDVATGLLDVIPDFMGKQGFDATIGELLRGMRRLLSSPHRVVRVVS